MKPRLLEQTVASFFRSLYYDYEVMVTGQTHNQRIDMILTGPDGKQIGVQIKQSKYKITIEQIRAFAGALLVAALPRGISVTTSAFTPGAVKRPVKLVARDLPIELLDAPRFYEALKLAQIVDRCHAPFM